MTPSEKQTGLIAWFTYNPVAANLLMIFILIAGVISYLFMTKRMMPDIQPNLVQISVPYLGAAPEEVEEGVVIKIEEAVQDVKGIKKIQSTAAEGVGRVMVQLDSDVDVDDALNEIKIKVDSISTFPGETEKPVISKLEFTADVMWLSVYGDLDRKARQTLAREIRDEIMSLPDVNKAEILGNRPYEIAIEVSEETLQSYDLKMSDISRAVRNFSLDLPGGVIKTEGGDIRLRTKGQAYTGDDFSNIVLRTHQDGTRLLLSDIAMVNDGFVESEGFARFNGKSATVIRVKSVGEQNDLDLAAAVRKYIEKKRETLPSAANVDIWGDGSVYLQQRLDMMFSNMLMGGFLVFLLLTMFLRFKVALWVMVGIPICFTGAFLFMDKLGPISTNINFLSLFGFILVLGIVVDDAIIIGESIYSEVKENGHSKENVIIGAKKVAMPATFGVLTTIAAFLPMLTLDNIAAPFFEAIGVVVVLCLLFSLVESKWILPSHLAHMKYSEYDEKKSSKFERFQHAIRQSMENFASNIYQPFLKGVLKHRYLTTVSFIMLMTIAVSSLVAGWVKFEIFPSIPNDIIQARFTLNEGSPIANRDALIDRMENAARSTGNGLAESENGGRPIIDHVLAWTNGDTGGGMLIELTKGEERDVDSWAFEKAWREKVGEVVGVKEMRFIASAGVGGDSALSFQLIGTNYKNLELASSELQSKLSEYDGVYDIRTSHSNGSQEIRLKLKPGAESLGFTLSDLGRQVRQAFYGEEAQRIQRGKDEIRVMVRYPKEERESIASLENMRLRTTSGEWVPFSEIAEFDLGTGYSAIQREDRSRAITVLADINQQKVKSHTINSEINMQFIPELVKKYPGVKSELSGAGEEGKTFLIELAISFLAAIAMIYVLLAIPLKSYSQPFIILPAIFFGFIGAWVGHIIYGIDFSMMSMFGLVALSGVVVNDSLVMVDFINRARREGLNLIDSVLNAGVKRFRAIMLTSLTTFFGLIPIMFETSLQAQVIIPMAVSLAFGIMFATAITLILVPASYLILQDIKDAFKGQKGEVKINNSTEISF